MFLNWTIMGDPLFFLNSAYSNESQSAVALWSEFKEQVQNPFTALKYVIIRSLPFILPFGVITVERIFTKRLLKWDYLVLVLFTGCMLGFHYVMLVLQKSFGWLRFFSFALITNIAWLPYELSQLKAKAKNITIVSTCVALLASAAMLPYYFADYDLAREEALTFYSDVETSDLVLQKDIARLINDKYSDSTILYDSFKMANVTLNLDNPKNIITNVADAVFDGAILYPQVSGVDYLVIPIPYVETENGVRDSGAGALDAINKEYPELYSDGADWADLVYDNGAYRVYKVLPRLYNDDRVLSAVNLPALEIADLINTEYSGHRLLLDNSTTGWVHKTLEHPEDAIVLVNESFAAAVKNPKANLVEYIVVPKVPVDTSGSVDAINRVYPALMDNTVDWATVVFENELYYLYEVPYEPGEIELLAQRQGEIEAAEKLYIRSKPQLDTAEFLNAQAQEGMLLLLADPAVAQPLIETLAHPGNLMDELSPLFAAAVENPQAQGIQYIILPAKDAPGIIKSVDSAYPSLYEYGPDWSELVFENETFRVYAVIYI